MEESLTGISPSIKLTFMNQKINLNDISRFDFNLAITFLALWQERSVSRAASRLSLSQSAVSAALARLRSAADDPLFVRTRGAMVPTPRAEAMAEDLANGVDLIRSSFAQQAAFNPLTSTAHFTIGMSDDFQLAIGPVISARIAKEAPNVTIIYRQTNRHRMEAAFEEDDIDCAVVVQPPARSWLEHKEVAQSGYACLLDAKTCGVHGEISQEKYLELPHLLVSFSGREGIVDEKLKLIGKRRRVQTALTHFAAVPPFLRGQRAITTIPSHAAAAIARQSGLQCLAPPIDLGTYTVSLVWRRDRDQEWLRDIVTASIGEALSSRPVG
nr:LysR family transcriptional regulator [uncultured Cohaesibacter sp.]